MRGESTQLTTAFALGIPARIVDGRIDAGARTQLRAKALPLTTEFAARDSGGCSRANASRALVAERGGYGQALAGLKKPADESRRGVHLFGDLPHR